jgi:N-acyl-L-homoserine lactone synthetase
MFHLRKKHSASVPDTVMRGMFAARKNVFVDLLKWDVPVLDGRFEIDQFDDIHADYLILTDDLGQHLASTRLLATNRPHILGDLFPQLCERAVPRDSATFEITRFCLDRSLTAGDRRAARDQLVVALVDHALAHGITSYVAIAAMSWFEQILSFGWYCEALGAPHIVGTDKVAAVRISIDATTPALLARAGIIAAAASADAVPRAAA